jgi:cobalt-zinc-cadmium efflux system outer membrane protein
MVRISTAAVCLIAIFFGASATAQQPEDTTMNGRGSPVKLTIEQAIDEAVQNNLGLLAERMNLTIAEASLITARLRPNPLLSLGGDHINPSNISNPPTELSFRIDVPIETADKRERRIAVAEHDRSIAEWRFLEAIRTLKLDVSQACVALLQAKAQLGIAARSVRLLDGLVRLNETRVQSGSVIPLELTRSRVSMFQFHHDVRRAELSLTTAKAKLQTLLGRKTVSDEFDIVGEMVEPMPGPTLELSSVVGLALATRPDLKVLERQVERSQADLKLQLAQAKADYLIGTEYRRQGFSAGANLLGVFFTVPLPFFNRNQGEIARAIAEHEQLLRQLQARKLEITAEVKTAYEEFRSARILVESIEDELLNAAEQARIISAYLYRTGESTLTDFLDTQRAYEETAQSYYEAVAASRRAAIQLNAGVGKEVAQWFGTGLANSDR